MFDDWKKKLEVIHKYINARKRGKFETSGIAVKLILAPFLAMQYQLASSRYRKLSKSSHKSFDELILPADRSFQYNGKCNGCGICVRVCPVDNIEMVDKK